MNETSALPLSSIMYMYRCTLTLHYARTRHCVTFIKTHQKWFLCKCPTARNLNKFKKHTTFYALSGIQIYCTYAFVLCRTKNCHPRMQCLFLLYTFFQDQPYGVHRSYLTSEGCPLVWLLTVLIFQSVKKFVSFYPSEWAWQFPKLWIRQH